MTISPDTIILSNITAQLDDLTRSLADVPGRAPQDKLIATRLLQITSSQMANMRSVSILIDELLVRQCDVDKAEAEAIASALEALALRLGAWLGR